MATGLPCWRHSWAVLQGKHLGAACLVLDRDPIWLWHILLWFTRCWEHHQSAIQGIAAASVERGFQLFHTGSGATCSSYCPFVWLLLKLICACVVAERAGSREPWWPHLRKWQLPLRRQCRMSPIRQCHLSCPGQASQSLFQGQRMSKNMFRRWSFFPQCGLLSIWAC